MSDTEIIYLHRISELPFDRTATVFDHYPGFKLGVTASVRHYAELLAPLVKRLITNDAEQDHWILTAPPLIAETPAGANLLCWELFDLYRGDCDALKPTKLSLSDMHYENEVTAAMDYAKLDFADRVTERERLSRRLVPDTSFKDRPILFINDICVTGAQQSTMQRYFDRAGAACVKWVYLVFVDPEVGKEKPQIEWEINSVPFAELLRLVSSEEIRFTGKCVQRLLHLSIDELEQVLGRLNEERRRQLHELALRNGFQHQPGLQDQMKLLDQNRERQRPELPGASDGIV